MVPDSETRLLFAREHAAILRANAEPRARSGRARRWLSGRLIELGLRLAPEPHGTHAVSRAVS
jgi:hypothetical protein